MGCNDMALDVLEDSNSDTQYTCARRDPGTDASVAGSLRPWRRSSALTLELDSAFSHRKLSQLEVMNRAMTYNIGCNARRQRALPRGRAPTRSRSGAYGTRTANGVGGGRE